MARFYRAPNKRLIARGGSSRFRQTTLADIGMGCCETCGVIFTPDYSDMTGMIDPREFNERKRVCPECRAKQ
jgi:rubredoxin